MSDMPDFDSMSPDEMMKWMESLAKRQGAAEGFTTDADMDIQEVDENDERLAEMGEYKPFGMSDEEWAKMQEREAAEKAERLAAMQAQAPEPEPTPEPVVSIPEPEPEPAQAVASADATPDFDNMSPEEMMEWMESLAKRQGAAEGFTTSASMDVAEVDENDERLAGMGEYKPFAMSDEEWARQQEREAAEKAERLAAMRELEAIADGEPEYVDDEDDEYVYEDDEEYEYYEDDEEFFEVPEDSEEFINAVLEPDTDPEAEEELPSFEDILPAQSMAEAESPLDWLEGLSAGDDDAPNLDLDLGGLGDLASLGEASAEADDDPMAWLAGLSANDDDNGAPDLSALMSDDSDLDDVDDEMIEGSLKWMESLAAEEGAPSEELFTDANINIPMPDNVIDDGPGYEEFSFEEATGMVNDTDTITPLASMDEDEDDLVLENPESWLDDLATGASSNEIPDDIFAGVADNEIPDDLFDDEAFADVALDDVALDDEADFDNIADTVKSQMDTGRLGDSPEDVDKFFQSAFAKASTRDDVPDYIDDEDYDEDDEEELAVAAEIPDWLQESMSSAPPAEDDAEPKKATAEMMILDLGLEEADEDQEIPDWLQGNLDDDSNVIEDDLFLEEVVNENEEEADIVYEGDDLNLSSEDTQDTWVAAFSNEDSQELESWYNSAVAQLGDTSEAPAITDDALAGAITLEHADLPIESKLPEGSPQNVPTWLSDEPSDVSVEVEAIQNDMSWLGDDFASDDSEDDVPAFAFTDSDDANIPDWLQETVDDSVTAGEDLPDWLAGETDISTDEIPDWLRETMDEEEASIDEVLVDDFLSEPEPEPLAPVASTPLPAPVQQSPAPVPVAASNVNAVEYLRSAKTKIDAGDIDGAVIDYEQVIRANKALSQVEKELTRLADDKQHAKNPAVNRVLGDVLMRQGKLQEALDTYRKALNML
ncbi:MAG: hypothetical protein AAF846_15585 [Chloroflexota bacterium]